MEHKIIVTISIAVFVMLCLIPSGTSLKCYQCATATNANCTYVEYHRSTIKPQECPQNVTLADRGFVPSCLKILTTNYYGRIVTHRVVRQCTWTSGNQSLCTDPELLRLYAYPGQAYQECDICSDRDGCNNGNSLTFLWSLIISGVIISAIAASFD